MLAQNCFKVIMSLYIRTGERSLLSHNVLSIGNHVKPCTKRTDTSTFALLRVSKGIVRVKFVLRVRQTTFRHNPKYHHFILLFYSRVR